MDSSDSSPAVCKKTKEITRNVSFNTKTFQVFIPAFHCRIAIQVDKFHIKPVFSIITNQGRAK